MPISYSFDVEVILNKELTMLAFGEVKILLSTL